MYLPGGVLNENRGSGGRGALVMLSFCLACRTREFFYIHVVVLPVV